MNLVWIFDLEIKGRMEDNSAKKKEKPMTFARKFY